MFIGCFWSTGRYRKNRNIKWQQESEIRKKFKLSQNYSKITHGRKIKKNFTFQSILLEKGCLGGRRYLHTRPQDYTS